MYGHIETMAGAIAEGAKSVEGVQDTVKRVPELLSDEAARKAGVKKEQTAPVASPAEPAEYDAFIFGTPTPFGNITAQMRNYFDRAGGLWMKGALIGKVASVFTGAGAGNESTILTFTPTLLYRGMIYVGLSHSCPELTNLSEMREGSPYGAATIAGPPVRGNLPRLELAMARFQRKHVATVASRLRL
jgi:NAD(P)H dehydrogenase (quinone)